jgi:hypothetical protein
MPTKPEKTMSEITLAAMLEQQETFNSMLNPNWRKENYDYILAASQECSELIDELGWKWWGSDKPFVVGRYAALQECTDILCFLLSAASVRGDKLDTFDPDAVGHYAPIADTVLMTAKHLQYLLHVDGHRAGLRSLHHVVSTLGFTQDEFYSLYLGKLALNMFRHAKQKYEGSYDKEWEPGLYDTEVLLGIHRVYYRNQDRDLGAYQPFVTERLHDIRDQISGAKSWREWNDGTKFLAITAKGWFGVAVLCFVGLLWVLQ